MAVAFVGLLFSAIVAASSSSSFFVHGACQYPVIFNFGDSTSDTGAVHYTFPFHELAENKPYGMSYFGKPTGRYSDGRLSIDFLATALGLPFLNPYLQSVGSSFGNGANFAAAGATARDSNSFIAPISLTVQLNQFKVFKQQVLSAIGAHGELSFLPSRDAFARALYVIEIAGNDFSNGYMEQKMTPAQVRTQVVPGLAKSVAEAAKALYAEGARTILVKDVAPQGCGSFWLTYFPDAAKNLDSHGCAADYNDAVKTYNRILRAELSRARSAMPGAQLVFVNTYDIIYDMFTRPREFGFTETTKACCGVGGNYNYRYSIQCGSTGVLNGKTVTAQPCANPGDHLSWDGVHWTDRANRLITQRILSGKFFDPPSFSLASACNLQAI